VADKVHFRKVAIIGFGLIGSSLARLMERDGLADEIAACVRSDSSLKIIRERKLAHIATKDPAEAVAGADLIVIATPLGAYGAVAEAIAPYVEAGAIVTDVGSVKGRALADLTAALPDSVHVVPGHPVAGTEHSGPEAGFADLFLDRWCILTPAPGCDPDAVARVKALWEAAGMWVEIMSAEHHDMVLAITSHLPHLIAYTIVGTATELEGDLKKEAIKFSAGGFRDFTRIAASDPVMWRDVFLTNRDAVLEVLGRFSEDLSRLQRAVRRGDGETLERLFTETRAIRRGIVEARQDLPEDAKVKEKGE
jgi:cyclohexadieny/prephenate dehydrogenase